MVVNTNDASGGANYSGPENIPRMDYNRIQSANTDEAMAFDTVPRIQKECYETLALRIKIWVQKEVGIPIFNDLLGRVAYL